MAKTLLGRDMILDEKQRELLRWYFVDRHSIAEIAEWRFCSKPLIENELKVLRAVFRSHGQELPRYNHGRPRVSPNLPETAVA
jgi:predicted DNA-binding protein YlxM (UPF0122 family)